MKVFSKLYETSSKIEVGKPTKAPSSTDQRPSAYKNPIIPKLNVRTKGQKTSVLGNHVTEMIAQKANKRLYAKSKAMQSGQMRDSGVQSIDSNSMDTGKLEISNMQESSRLSIQHKNKVVNITSMNMDSEKVSHRRQSNDIEPVMQGMHAYHMSHHV